MSDTIDGIPEEMHVLAGEYVLGALDLGEMRAVRRQSMVDPTLALAISGWERRLAPMAAAVAPLRPPVALWSRIEQAIAPVPDETAEETVPTTPVRPRLATVLPPPEPPVGPRPSELERLRPPGRPVRRVWPWQVATIGSLAIAAGVAALVLMPSLAQRAHLPMLVSRFSPEVAALMPANSTTPGFLAEARADGTVVLTTLAQVDVPAGKALELWILPPGAAAPRSLGVLPPGGRQIALAAMPPSETDLMVSLEPPGGSPTGAPTGPVVYAGKLRHLRP